MRGQNLYRDGAIQASVARAIHLAHAARAERRLYFVRAEFCARGKTHARAIIACAAVADDGILDVSSPIPGIPRSGFRGDRRQSCNRFERFGELFRWDVT